MRRQLLKVSAPLLLVALLGFVSEARAEGRVRQLVRTLTAKIEGRLNKPVSRRQFLGIETMRQATKVVRRTLSELKAEHALMPVAIESAPKVMAKKTSRRPDSNKKAASTGPDLGRRRMLGLLAAGLVVAAVPKPVQALDFKGTKQFLVSIFGEEAHGSEPPKHYQPAKRTEHSAPVKDRAGPISPISANDGRMGSRFSKSRLHPVYRDWRPHNGVDIKAPHGSRVGAALAGTVIFAGPHKGFGNVVVVLHPNGTKTIYAHLSRIEKKYFRGVSWKRRRFVDVAQGEKIGAVGATGVATGAHLHFEYRANASDKTRFDGKPLDPEHHVDFAGINGWKPRK